MIQENNELLLSICIPTRGRPEILRATLDSIYTTHVMLSRFEVVIYDSSDDDHVKKMLSKYFKYENITYLEGENSGYLNLIKALKCGKGKYLKLHNDYSCFLPGALNYMLDMIAEQYFKGQQAVLFFLNEKENNAEEIELNTFNDFINHVSYISSWSTAFGIWKEDFDKINGCIFLEKMFPHTSLLFAMSNKTEYIVSDRKIFNNVEVNKKGGYNLFYTFGVIYLKMLEQCIIDKAISAKTFEKVKCDMLNNFFPVWYCNTVLEPNEYTFELTDIKKSMSSYYTTSQYYYMLTRAYITKWKRKLQ